MKKGLTLSLIALLLSSCNHYGKVVELCEGYFDKNKEMVYCSNYHKPTDYDYKSIVKTEYRVSSNDNTHLHYFYIVRG